MKIFLSWSGSLSRSVAEALRLWLPQVINAVDPWLSSEDIQKGARWFDEVGSSLEQTQFGIICLTKENLTSPWVLFEAGALSKSLAQSRVTPLLIDLKNSDLNGPLAQFQTTLPLKAEVWKLVLAINQSFINGSSVSEQILSRSYEKWWPDLERDISEALKTNKTIIPGHETRKVASVNLALEELIETNRALVTQTAQLLNSFSKEEPIVYSNQRFENTNLAENSYTIETIRKFAAELRKDPQALFAQFRAAGVKKNNIDEVINDTDKQRLLTFLQNGNNDLSSHSKKIVLVKKNKK
jgi:TIR domain